MSELAKRIVSGVVMAVVLLGDLWLGSWWYLGLLVIGGLLVFREYARLVLATTMSAVARRLWLAFGVVYISSALFGLWRVRALPDERIANEGLFWAAALFILVWSVDVGAFVFGRLIGGPKIAPKISPSKTWAGLLGGIVFAGTTWFVLSAFGIGAWPDNPVTMWLFWTLAVAPLAVLAQGGDFFQSWMKRRAGVKDSGTLIPGHGGLFDRVDGLLPVAIVFVPMIGLLT